MSATTPAGNLAGLRCENCDHPIFLNSGGTYTHVGNTTSSPTTCYRPDGAQFQARPRTTSEETP